MDTFTVRDLRERTGTLIHDAEEGKLSLITKHGVPVIIAVPFTREVLDAGLRTTLAIKLFQDEALTLEKAAKFAGTTLESFIEILGQLGVPTVNYSVDELEKELTYFAE